MTPSHISFVKNHKQNTETCGPVRAVLESFMWSSESCPITQYIAVQVRGCLFAMEKIRISTRASPACPGPSSGFRNSGIQPSCVVGEIYAITNERSVSRDRGRQERMTNHNAAGRAGIKPAALKRFSEISVNRLGCSLSLSLRVHGVHGSFLVEDFAYRSRLAEI